MINGNNNSSLNMYFSEISKYPLLSEDEVSKLMTEYQNGNIEAKNILINSNLRLVVNIAKKYKCNIPINDLIQEGNIGLINAIENFKLEFGNKLSTYATIAIKRYIENAINAQNNKIRIPSGIYRKKKIVDNFINNYCKEFGKNPSIDIISEYLKLPKSEIKDLINMNIDVKSLNTKIGETDDSEIQDYIVDKKTDIEKECTDLREKEEFFSLISEILTERELNVVYLRYGFKDGSPRKFKEIAQILNMSEKNAIQTDIYARNKLKMPTNKRKIKQYVHF